MQDILEGAKQDHIKMTKTYVNMWRDNLNPNKTTAARQQPKQTKVGVGLCMEGLIAKGLEGLPQLVPASPTSHPFTPFPVAAGASAGYCVQKR